MVKNTYFSSETLPSSRPVLALFVFTVASVIGAVVLVSQGRKLRLQEVTW